VKLYVSALAFRCVEIVSVLDPVPFDGGVTEFGEKEHDTRFGVPLQDKATGLANPPVDVIVQVLVTLLPRTTERFEGEHTIVKSPAGAAAVVKLKTVL
jgi:hypothetical protein